MRVQPRRRSPGWRAVPRGTDDATVTIGVGLTDTAPGSYKATHLVVTDIEAARNELVGRGVEVGNFHYFDENGRHDGLHPDRADYGTFASFEDPDGNLWLLQERKGSA